MKWGRWEGGEGRWSVEEEGLPGGRAHPSLTILLHSSPAFFFLRWRERWSCSELSSGALYLG